jgi:hypothetical protein
MFYPDYVNSVYELENYKNKKEIIDHKKEINNGLKEQAEKNLHDILTGSIIPLEWKNIHQQCTMMLV